MKIIVLTPVKNEEWILEKFIIATSLFADCIIIADQHSTDNSRAICSKFSKVKLIDNTQKNYDEANRQLLLIEAARNFFPDDERVLFCLDADEIISADSLNSKGWDVIRNSPKGTVFKFEKPTIFFDSERTIRYFDGWPLAYKDDGAAHEASIIHSIRVPVPSYAKQIFIEDIKFLHFCFVRKNIQFSKNRFYCAIENVNQVRSLSMRWIMYHRCKPEDYENEGTIQSTQAIWFEYYDMIGLDLKNFEQSKYYWMDYEVLKMFEKYGASRFFNDNIWYFDWEACRLEALKKNIGQIPSSSILTPSLFRRKMILAYFKVFNTARNIDRYLRHKFNHKQNAK